MNNSFCRYLGFALLIFQNRRLNLKHDAKNCSATHFAAHFDTSTVLSHDVLRHPQPQASSLLASGEERIEDAIQIVFGNPHSAVTELDHDRGLQCSFVTKC